MNQPSLFDAPATEQRRDGLREGRRLRDEGIALVAEHDPNWVIRARRVAIGIAGRTGTVAADSLREEMERRGDMPGAHPNVWGSVFCRFFFEKIPGSYRPSTSKSAHARNIPEYRLTYAGRHEFNRKAEGA